MFLSTRNMKSAMRSSDPTVVQMDTTFEVDKARYKLAAFCCLNIVTNKTEVGFYVRRKQGKLHVCCLLL